MKPDTLIEKCYDYITEVTQKQGFLFPIRTLYGDGSRFEYNYIVFESVYNKIKEYLNS